MGDSADRPSQDSLGAALAREEAERDRAYRAIGHYTVQFSLLMYAMRRIWSGHIAQGDEQRRELLELAFGDTGAYPIAQAFFATCKKVADLDDDEKAISTKLRKEVEAEISERNNIVHGDWLIGFWVSGSEQPVAAQLVRLKASSQTKPFEWRSMTTDELDKITARVEHLANVVWQFGLACTRLGKHRTRLRDLIHVASDGRLVQPEGTVWVLPNPHGP